MTLPERVLRVIQSRKLLTAGERVIVGVSGGMDSVALLHILWRLRGALGVDIHVASFDHGIRGMHSQRDQELVAELAARWGLPFTPGRGHVPALAERWKVGLEEAARRARYDFLARVMAAEGGDCVAVGHHALDQAETILMHIARGSGLRGITGMRFTAPMPHHPGIRLIRPLLELERAQIANYCQAQGLPFQHDKTNDDASCLRNFIRHQLLSPFMRRQPGLLRAFTRLAEAAALDEDFLDSQLADAALPRVTIGADAWSLPRSRFDDLHPALQRRLLRMAFGQLAGASDSLSHALTLDTIAWLTEGGVGKRRDLGGGIQVRLGYETLHIERNDVECDPGDYRLIPPDTQLDLPAPTTLRLGEIGIDVRAGSTASDHAPTIVVPASAHLQLRTRQPGDRFCPLGMAGRSRKLKDWMIDRKIPRQLRERIPLLCADGIIIAICVKATWHLAHQPFESADAGAACTLILR